MEKNKVSDNKQITTHEQENRKTPATKRNNIKKKNNSNQKKKNISNKAKNNLNKSFDDLEKKLEAKLESSLGLTSDSNPKRGSVPKNGMKRVSTKKNLKTEDVKNSTKNIANKNRSEIIKQSLNKNKKVNNKSTIKYDNSSEENSLFNFSKLKLGRKSKSKRMDKSNGKIEKISIIPLGGLGEIGKNMTAIKYGNSILVVDGGMSFPDDDLPGIDLVIPDYNYLLENRNMVKAFVVTHGHEDHIGGLPYILNDLPVPVYGGKLTLGLIKSKLEEHNINGINLAEVKNRDMVQIGPFKVEFIRVSHSIPDSFALAIHTPAGIIVHTGDFKLDMSPVDNQFMDLARFSELGEQGVLLMMADSTNVERPGFTASEKVVGQTLETTFLGATGRIIVTSFASNVHRIQQVIWAAEATNRKVSVVGRGMTNVMDIAMDLGYLQIKPDTLVDISEITSYPDNKVAILTTGSQGESFAGLTRMSQGEHKQIKIRPGDLIVISANAIPGNEKTVAKTIDNLYRRGAEVMYGRGLGIHVSGHASIEDLKLIFNMVKPKFFMPVHGEYRMLCAHGKLAEKMGVPQDNIFLLENGEVLDLTQKEGKINGKVHSGRILIDGLGVGDIGTAVLKERRQLSNDGIVIANIVMDKQHGRSIAEPYLVSRGFVYERDNDLIISEAEQIIQNICDEYLGKNYNLPAMKNHLRSAIGKYLYEQTGRKPIILPIIMEV
jgi:ribonuclease J